MFTERMRREAWYVALSGAVILVLVYAFDAVMRQSVMYETAALVAQGALDTLPVMPPPVDLTWPWGVVAALASGSLHERGVKPLLEAARLRFSNTPTIPPPNPAPPEET